MPRFGVTRPLRHRAGIACMIIERWAFITNVSSLG
jgi:hypothetical protein